MKKIREFVDVLRAACPNFENEKVIEDLESSVEEFGIKVYYSDMSTFPNPSEISGFSRVNSKGLPEIVVNGEQSEQRRRFTIAHELGHIVMHWKWLNTDSQTLDKNFAEILYRKNNEYTPEESVKEQQANEFAAEILAPLDSVRKMTSDYHNKNAMEKTFLELRIANDFKISRDFARIQIDKAVRG